MATSIRITCQGDGTIGFDIEHGRTGDARVSISVEDGCCPRAILRRASLVYTKGNRASTFKVCLTNAVPSKYFAVICYIAFVIRYTVDIISESVVAKPKGIS